MSRLWRRLRWFVHQHWENREQIIKQYPSTAIFWCRDARDLPDADVLRDAAKQQLQGVLCFSKWLNAPEKADCIAWIEEALPNCEVGTRRPEFGFDFVGFARVLNREAVLEKAPELLASSREFGALATELAHELAAKIGITPAQLTAHGQYQPHEIRFERRGNLNKNWTYGFHGFQCIFVHQRIGQIVDVEFGFGEEFGVLDPMFWHSFLRTTPRYSHLARWMALGYSDAKFMFDTLTEANYLSEIQGKVSHGDSSWDKRGFIPAPEC